MFLKRERQNRSLFWLCISVQMNSHNSYCRKVTIPLGTGKCGYLNNLSHRECGGLQIVNPYFIHPLWPTQMIWLAHTIFKESSDRGKMFKHRGVPHKGWCFCFPRKIQKTGQPWACMCTGQKGAFVRWWPPGDAADGVRLVSFGPLGWPWDYWNLWFLLLGSSQEEGRVNPEQVIKGFKHGTFGWSAQARSKS